ncbi:MAG: ribosome silencing factor [Candidatus Goldiibacteriota bacterium]|jgi:ribosome-associated protein
MKKVAAQKKAPESKKTSDRSKLERVISILNSHKGVDIRAFNTSKGSGLWDYFVVCSGASYVHTGALRDHLKKEMIEAGYSISYEDRDPETRWIALDFGDIMVHIFDPDTRMFYAIERIWGGSEEDVSSLTV